MDLFKNLSKFLVIFSIAIFAVSCGDDDEPTTSGDPTIAELASDTDNLSILVAALDRADLVSTLNGDGPFTVFAPTNEAFENFLATNGFNSLEDIPVDVLSSVLLNHVVSGSVSSSQLTTGYIETAATEATSGNNINMYVNTTNGVTLNGTSQVTQADIAADNGIVHVVNEVIGLPSVVTFATADNTFSTLVAA
ncbi:MAG: fasciclin domain-containing protein, partial [Saprospiraceae bacterium]